MTVPHDGTDPPLGVGAVETEIGGGPTPYDVGSAPAAGTPAPSPSRNRRRRPPASRTGRVWVAVAAFVLVLIVILVFILQNLDRQRVHFLAWSGSLPVGLALLFAAILGALIVLLIGSIRIIQLRRTTKRGGGAPASPPG